METSEEEVTSRIFRDKGREEALETGGIDYDRMAHELFHEYDHVSIAGATKRFAAIATAAREAGRREMREECAEAAAAWSRSRGGSDQVTQKLADAIRSIPVRKP